jgi:cytidyltransferase-like protein
MEQPKHIETLTNIVSGSGRKRRGRKIGSTIKRKIGVVSGYFNPLHPGHLDMLRVVRNLSKLVIVIVNNDFQREKKGTLPFLSAQDRALILMSLRYVDQVFVSISLEDDVSTDLITVAKLYPKNRNDIIFYNSGDRDEASWHPKEVEACQKLGIGMEYLKLEKINSSSIILENVIKAKNNIQNNL